VTIEVAAINAHQNTADALLTPFVHTGSIAGLPVDMLFDTGAPASLIDVTIYYKIPADSRPLLQAAPDSAGPGGRPCRLRYTGLGGASTYAAGCAVFTMEIGGQTTRHWLWVVDMQGLGRGLILGLDFQVALDVSLEPAKRRAMMGGRAIPLHRRTTKDEDHPVRSLYATRLPAGSSQLVTVEIQGNDVYPFTGYTVRPVQEIMQDLGLVMAHCVVCAGVADHQLTHNRVATVALVNPGERDVWLKNGQLLGIASEVVKVEPLRSSCGEESTSGSSPDTSDAEEQEMLKLSRDFPSMKAFQRWDAPKTVKMGAIMGYPEATPAWPSGAPCNESEDGAMPTSDWDGDPQCGGADKTDQSFPPTEDMFPHVPEHLRSLIDGCKLETWSQRKALANLLVEYQDVFAAPGGQLGHTNLVQHKIDVGDNSPIKQRPRRVPLGKKQVCDEELDRLEDEGIIEPSNSPWSSPVVLVTKKDGSVRFCVDYRKLNEITVKDAYPIPKIEDCIDTLSGSKWFCTLDLLSGYHQVEMDEADKEKTAFSTHRGHHQFTRMSFGLTNAPATFERLMDLVLKGLNWEQCLVYLDDVVVFGNSFEETMVNLRLVLERFREANLKIKPPKCALFQREVLYLGHIISENGVACDPSKIEAVTKWPVPKTVKDVRSFLGFAGYYRRFVEDFAGKAAPLHDLTRIDAEWVWTPACQAGFESLKSALTTAPVLGYPRDEGTFVLDTDASLYGVGAVLSQVQDGEERVLSYVSKKLSKSQVNYCTTKRELLAVVLFTKHFSHYLLGRSNFLLRTDHASIRWLCNFKGDEGMLARWISQLQQYNFEIQHRAGKDHGNADGMSRRPIHLCPRDDCPDCAEYKVVEIGVIEVGLSRQARRRRAASSKQSDESDDEHRGPVTRSKTAAHRVVPPDIRAEDVASETQGGPPSDSAESDRGSVIPESSSDGELDSDSEGFSDPPTNGVGEENQPEPWPPSNWLETLTPALLREAQLKDVAIREFLEAVEAKRERPPYASLEFPA